MNHTRPERRGSSPLAGQNSSQPKPSNSRSLESTDRIQYPGTCTAVIGSMTQAMKAQSALAAASIRASITKISSNKQQSGCVYGLDFPSRQKSNVQEVLSNAQISVRHYLGGD